MINLIPKEEKQTILRNFYFRFISLFFIMLGISFFITSISLIPSYVLSIEKKNTISSKIDTQKKEVLPEIDQKSMTTINELNVKLDIFNKSQENNYSVSGDVINKILSKRIVGIKITQIAYDNDVNGDKNINVNGEAKSREQLLAFRRLFENDVSFKKVDLPISNFVKDSEIFFNLNLISS